MSTFGEYRPYWKGDTTFYQNYGWLSFKLILLENQSLSYPVTRIWPTQPFRCKEIVFSVIMLFMFGDHRLNWNEIMILFTKFLGLNIMTSSKSFKIIWVLLLSLTNRTVQLWSLQPVLKESYYVWTRSPSDWSELNYCLLARIT